jgi:hypothetical protein
MMRRVMRHPNSWLSASGACSENLAQHADSLSMAASVMHVHAAAVAKVG